MQKKKLVFFFHYGSYSLRLTGPVTLGISRRQHLLEGAVAGAHTLQPEPLSEDRQEEAESHNPLRACALRGLGSVF